MIEDEVTGLLCDPGDTKGLAEALVVLLKNDALRHAMGQAGKDRLEREFSFEMFRQRLEVVLV